MTKRLERVQALIPRIRGLHLQTDDGKGRHKADDVDEGGDACVLTREMQMMLDNAMCELEEGQQRTVQQPGCFAGPKARRLSRGDKPDAACWATWDLRAKVIPQLATDMGRAVAKVADGGLAEQARQRLDEAGICARPNAILKLTTCLPILTLKPGERCYGNPRPHHRERRPGSERRLLARILHGLEAVKAAILWEMAGDELQISQGLAAGCSLHDADGVEGLDVKVMLRADSAHCSNFAMTQSGNVHNHPTADSTTHSYAKLDWHGCANKCDSVNPDELAEAEWGTGGQGAAGTAHVRVREERQRWEAVKEAILDLAVNFPGQRCTHWVDVSVRARYTNKWEKGCGLRCYGRGGQVEALQEQGTPDGDGAFWKDGPGVGESAQSPGDGGGADSPGQAGAARVARQAAASALVCDGGCRGW